MIKLRNLENYKKQQQEVAKKKGLLKELQNATTLTQARKILYGSRKKNQ